MTDIAQVFDDDDPWLLAEEDTGCLSRSLGYSERRYNKDLILDRCRYGKKLSDVNQSTPVAPWGMHRASMNSRHHHLSCANSSKSSKHSSPASRLIVRIHVSFGLPLPFLPCTCQPGVPRTITPSLLKTCSIHFHRDNLTYSSTGCTPVISLTLSIQTLSHHLTPKILRKALFSKTTNFLSY